MYAILVFVGFLQAVASVTECPSGWSYYTVTGSCYYVETTNTTFAAAESSCQGMGAHLVSIHSLEENAFVRALIPAVQGVPSHACYNGYWIGYTGNGTLGAGSWTDGSADNFFKSGYFSSPPSGVYYWMLDAPGCYDVWIPNGPTYPTAFWIYGFICEQPGPAPPPVAVCPPGWTYHAVEGSCYYLQGITPAPGVFPGYQYKFTEAEAFCQGMDAHLASIHSNAENEFIRDNLIPIAFSNFCYTYWIGYTGNGTLGTGSWTDGSADDYFRGYNGSTVNYWSIGDPNCADLWYQTDLSWPYGNIGFLCEKPGLPPTQSPTKCPPDWAYYAPTESCYYVEPLTASPCAAWPTYTFSDAEAACQALSWDAHLASIHSDGENKFITGLIPIANPYECYTYWIGYTGDGNVGDGSGSWTDGSADDYFIGYNDTNIYNFAIGDVVCKAQYGSVWFGNGPITSSWYWIGSTDLPGYICKQAAY